MKKQVWLALALLALVLAACVYGSGDIVTETRDVDSFDGIAIGGSGELLITQGDEENLTVEADENLLRYIRTQVRGDTLELGLRVPPFTMLVPRRPIRYVVTVRDLNEVRIAGSADARIGDLETDRLAINISGSGDVAIARIEAEELESNISGSGTIEVTGEVTEQSLNVSGSGEYDAADLASEVAQVRIGGSGNATIWVESELDAEIAGSGQVSYYGQPEVQISTSGSGDIRSLGSRE